MQNNEIATFWATVWCPKSICPAKSIGHTLRALHIVHAASGCLLDVFKTEYTTILCDSNPKLG